MGIRKWEDLLKEQLEKFKDGAYGYWSFLDPFDRPLVTKGKSLMTQATIMLNENDKEISKHVNYISRYFSHPYTGGYWSKVNKNNTVAVDNINAYYGRDTSPFPIKSMVDHAVLAFSLRSAKTKEAKLMLNIIIKQLSTFWNSKSGGISLGQGNWFSTPTTPTVPLARHVMVPQHTVGSFAVGNTFYLPLQEKSATLQLIASIALKGKPSQNHKTLKVIPYEINKFKVNHDPITNGSLQNSDIDVTKYVQWLNKTKSGFGNGLTPYRSPLGFKSDKTPQNFSAMHVISDLSVLGKEIENKNKLFLTMKAAQNEDGGFSEQPSLPSELFTTYCVVLSAYILKTRDFNVEKCIKFVKNCQNEDGGFGNTPGYPSDAWHCNFGTLILHILKSYPTDKEGLVQYLLNCQNEDGGFSIIPGSKSEVFSSFRAIDSLIVSGIKIPHKTKATHWLQNLQSKEGGFNISERKATSFVGTYHAIAALYLLNTLPLNIDLAKKWFSNHQAKDGGFSKMRNSPSDTTDEGFIAIHASYMLENKLNPYWTAIIT